MLEQHQVLQDDQQLGDAYFERTLLDSLFCESIRDADAALIYSQVRREHFFSRELGLVFAVSQELSREGLDATDSVAIVERLRATNRIREAGGVAAVCDATLGGATAANALHWARVVVDQYRRRTLGIVGAQAVSSAEDPQTVIEPAAVAFADRLIDLASAGVNTQPASLAEQAKLEFHELTTGAPAKRSLKSGFYDLDRSLGGLGRGRLIVLAGRTTTGKTALALVFAANIAKRGMHVLYFSAEMDRSELLHRLVTMETGTVVGSEAHDVAAVGVYGAEWLGRFHVHDESRMTVSSIRAQVRSYRDRFGDDLGIVVVDYLQLLQPAKASQNREREVAEMSAEMKRTSRDCEVPLVCLSQLSRAADQASKPQLCHLRESGAIEQDSDVVLLLDRDDENPRVVDAIIAKNRQTGQTGTRQLGWDADRALFTSIESRRTA